MYLSNEKVKDEIKWYKKEHQDFYITLFKHTFSLPPWNEEWNREEIRKMSGLTAGRKGFLGLTAFSGNTPAGFLFAYRLKVLFFSRMYYLQELFVDTRVQGKGLGKKLCSRFYELLQKEGPVQVLLLTKKPSPAYTFYLKQGFKDFLPFLKIGGKVIMSKKI